MEREYITEREVPEYIEKLTGAPISRRTLMRWRSEGVGPPYRKVGMRVIYRRQAIEEWLRDGERTPPRTRRRK